MITTHAIYKSFQRKPQLNNLLTDAIASNALEKNAADGLLLAQDSELTRKSIEVTAKIHIGLGEQKPCDRRLVR